MKKQKGGGYMKLYRSIAYSAELTATEKLIWCIIADKVEAEEHFHNAKWAVLSISETAKSLGVARNTVVKALHKLCECGLVERQMTMIPGYPDKYTVPSQDVADAIIESLDRHGK